MSKETVVFFIGVFIFLSPFLGLPGTYKKWFFMLCGLLLIVIGYQLRRSAFLKSLEHETGELRGDAFVESDTLLSENEPPHHDSRNVI